MVYATRSICSCSQAVSKPVWHIPLLCVQWKTPDDGQRNCPKHVDFHSKNKSEKLVHLVGFIIRSHSEQFATVRNLAQFTCSHFSIRLNLTLLSLWASVKSVTSHTHCISTSHLNLLNCMVLLSLGNSTYNHTSQGSPYLHTVELGYNDLGYHDTSDITSNTLWYQLIPHKERVFLPRLVRHT